MSGRPSLSVEPLSTGFVEEAHIDGSAYPDAFLRLQLQISQFLGYLVDDGWGKAGACLWKRHKF